MNQDEHPTNATNLVPSQGPVSFTSAALQADGWSLRKRLIACAVLALAALLTFWPVLQADFVNLDDGEYVLQNPHVATGLSPVNVAWAFTTGYASNWHPLTWLSHMLDVQLFGLRPAGHHLVSLLLHVANTIILFALLMRLTGAPWRSFVVAALFALHPLHVESVAWIAERKDVLSTLFFFLTIWTYAQYVSLKSPPWYRLALLLFALGLMSKPMLVTMPAVLLLLDYWPLHRSAPDDLSWHAWRPLLKEKLPFLALAIASSLITIVAQAKAHSVKIFLPLGLRLENAVVSYWSYLTKAFWPAHLSVFYPHPNTRFGLPQADLAHPVSEQWPLSAILFGAIILVAVSILLVRARRRVTWLTVGWFWFLITLLPVIGIIQVGMQAIADRYTYIPLIGIFVGVVWSIAEFTSHNRLAQPVLAGLATVVLAACAFLAHTQAGYWRDDFTLFSHALSVTKNNAMAECHVGAGMARQGRFDLAEAHFKAALADDPYFYAVYSSLGSLYELQGQPSQAIEQYRTTLKMRPWDEFARIHLAGLLHKLGKDPEALTEYKQNLQANPDSIEGNYQLGALLLDSGDLDNAARFLANAVNLKPDHVDALLCLSELRAKQNKFSAAQAALEPVINLYPTNFELRINFAGLLWQGGRESEALKQYGEAIRLQPNMPIGHYDLAVALAAQGKLNEATKELEEAIRLKPDYTEALSELAWLLATNPRAEQRNGVRALALSRRALELGAKQQARTWAALDVAFAENGQFTNAISAAEKARGLAAAQGQTNAAAAAQERLSLYQAQRPYRLHF